MKPETVAGIFEPLKAPSLSPIGQSAARSGLGLYNVRLYTERMGGTVTCESTPQRGTLFRITLPGPITTVAPQPRLRDVDAAKLAKNKLVAILDDDVSVLRTTERLFGSLGVEVFAHSEPLVWLNGVVEMKRMPDLVHSRLPAEGWRLHDVSRSDPRPMGRTRAEDDRGHRPCAESESVEDLAACSGVAQAAD